MDYIKTKDDFSMFKYDGIQAMRIGNLDFAMDCFDRALAIQDDAETHKYYAQALVTVSDLEGAIEELECVRTLEPENVENLIQLADLYFQTENYGKSEETCNIALQADSSLALPHYILAKVSHARKDFINAVAQATLAITTADEFYDAYELRCRILVEMEQFAEAEKDIDVVLEHTSDNDEALMLKAGICEHLGKMDEAEKCYHNVIDLNPFIPDAYFRLGTLMMTQGRKDEAEKLAKEALEFAPEAIDGINGEFTNWEQKMKETYKSNPFGLG